MAPWHYTMRSGFSANGQNLHPSEADPEEGIRFTNLEDAQSGAEQAMVRRLRWDYNPDIQTWTAVVGDGRVVEICQGTTASIRLSVDSMP
jgi:hypothetical protein